MDPVTLATIAVTTAAVGTGINAYAAHQQGQAQAAMYRYQAQVAENNKTIAEQYAQQEVLKGQRLEEQKRQETAQREGGIRAAAGAGGLLLDSGSPLRLQEDTARLGELDAQTIRDNAARAAYGYRVQGMNYAAQAGLDEAAASNAARSGALGMWSSIIGGASDVSGKWARFKMTGASPFGF